MQSVIQDIAKCLTPPSLTVFGNLPNSTTTTTHLNSCWRKEGATSTLGIRSLTANSRQRKTMAKETVRKMREGRLLKQHRILWLVHVVKLSVILRSFAWKYHLLRRRGSAWKRRSFRFSSVGPSSAPALYHTGLSSERYLSRGRRKTYKPENRRALCLTTDHRRSVRPVGTEIRRLGRLFQLVLINNYMIIRFDRRDLSLLLAMYLW